MKVITIEDYNKAVEVINKFHKQLDDMVNGGKTEVAEWLSSNKVDTRTANVLMTMKRNSWNRKNVKVFIEDIDKASFLKVRNAGIKSWENFVKLRGY